MKPCLTIQRPLAQLALALLGWVGLTLDAAAQLSYTLQSTPADLVATQSGSGSSGEIITTPQPVMESGDWRFSRWTVNGVPVLSPAGPARTQARVTLAVDATVITAIYLPSAQDSDGDSIPDWQEWRDFGTLSYNTASNPDGDGADTGLERRRGWAPALVDNPLQGGVSRSGSATFRYHNVATVYSYSIRSAPSGLLVPQSGEVSPGTEITTPNPTSEVQGYWFTHWTLNGVRQAAPDGAARTRLIAAIAQDDTQFVAHFVHKDQDSDGDGVPDWIELRRFGHLGTDANADPDADSLSTGVELVRGYDPGSKDTLLEGGMARSASASFNYHNPERWVYYSIKSAPVGLIEQSGLVPTNTVITTSNEDNERQGYRLAYWTVNGVPQTAANGYALTRLQVALSEDYMQFVAHFVPKDQDSDGDGIADWIELRHFGNLDQTTASDPDGDSFDFGTEQARGYAPNVVDQMLVGGLSRSASPKVTFLNPALYKLYTLSSQPAGFYLQSQVLEPGASVVTPNEFGPKQSYSFGYWTLNGVRQSGPTGVARSRLQLTADSDLNVVGHFTLTSADTDTDLLPDWWEAFYLGSLDQDRDSDPDGDGFSVGREYERGLPPTVPDLALEGGVSRTASRTIAVHRPSVFHPYVIRSEPAGLIPRQEGVVAPGEAVTTPLLNGVTQGFSFTYWSINGVRQAGPTGRALNRVATTIDAATELVAHYLGDAVDSDGDGIRDALEWLEFGTLENNASSDPDADDFTLAEEVGRGYSSSLADVMLEGGTSRSASKTVLMQLAAYNVYHPLAVTVDPPGGGVVSGGGSYKQGVTARLEAVVPPGVNGLFTHWSGDLAGSDNPAFITMDGPRAVTAHFTVAAYRLKYATTAHGSVTGSLDQTVAPGDNGTTVTAVPDEGYHFVQWSDGLTANPRTDTNVNAPVDVAATFAINVYPVVFDLGVLGSRSGGGALLQNIEHGSPALAPEFTVAAHWRFIGWSTAFSSVTSALTVTAQYERITHFIELAVNPPTAGGVSGGGTLPQGEPATVSAQRQTGWKFLGWSEAGELVSTNLDYTFTVATPRALVAQFEPLSRQVSPVSVQKDLTAQSYQIAVTSNTDWAVESAPAWATVLPTSGSGNALLTVTLSQNLTASSRSGVIRFSGFELLPLDHSLTQLGGVIKLSHSHAAFGKAAGKGNVSVSTSHYHLAWTATSNDPWLHLTSGDSGSGNGTVSFTVDAYDGAAPRTGSLTIGGHNFTVMQSAKTPTGQLTVHVDGLGTLSGVKVSQPTTKTVGRSVTLTAKPALGQRFAGWTGTGITFPPGSESRTQLKFVMGETVELTARFEPDPYLGAFIAGGYAGIAHGSDPADLASNGHCSFRLTKTGAFTCAVRTAGGSYSGKGALTADGIGQVLISRKKQEPVHLALVFDATTRQAEVTARLASEIGPVLWTSQAPALYVAPKGINHPATGRFTALLGLPVEAMPDFGDGYAAITVTRSGALRLTGKLPDGTAVTGSGLFDQNEAWSWFTALYRRQGFVQGLVQRQPDATLTTDPLLHWVKKPVAPTSKDRYYRDGFDWPLALLAEPYVKPLRGQTALQVALPADNLRFEASGAGLLEDPLVRTLTLSTSNTLTAAPDATNLKIKLNVSTGLFSLSFTHDGIVKKVTGAGALLQGSNHGAGVFISPTQAGSLTLEAVEP